MNGKGSKPRSQLPGPDGKTPNRRYADNWSAVFGHCAPTTAPHAVCGRAGRCVCGCATCAPAPDLLDENAKRQ